MTEKIINPVEIKVSASMLVTTSYRDLSDAIMRVVCQLTGVEDDAGCQWYSVPKSRDTFINNPSWVVTTHDHAIAALVDAANYLKLGYIPPYEK